MCCARCLALLEGAAVTLVMVYSCMAPALIAGHCGPDDVANASAAVPRGRRAARALTATPLAEPLVLRRQVRDRELGRVVGRGALGLVVGSFSAFQLRASYNRVIPR